MNFNKILRYLILSGIFLMPFIPLIMSKSMFFPFITGKNFAFRIIVELILGGYIILALRNSLYRPKFSWLLVAIASFVGIIAVADVFGENPFKSFWSNFERMEGLVTLLHLFAYFLVVSAMLNAEKLWTRFFNTTIGVSVFIGIFGLFQLGGVFKINQGGVRLDATLGNATYLAIYMLLHIFLTLFLLARWRGASFVRWLYGGIIALQIIILYFTATRGAIIGFIGGILLASFIIALFEKERKVMRKLAIGILIAVVLMTGLFFGIKNTDSIKQNPVLGRLASISLEDGQTRFRVWNMAVQGVKEKPILGWGQENFNIVFNKYYNPQMYDQEPWFDRVHNIIFDWLIAGGILGLIGYLFIYVMTLYYLWRRSGFLSITEKSIFTGLLAGYFFHNLFVFDNITSYIIFFSVLSYVHFMGTTNVNGSAEKMPIEFNRGVINRIAVPAIIVLTAFSFYAFNAKGILTARTLLKALIPQQEGVSKNIELYEKALAYDTVGGQEVREQLLRSASVVARGDFDTETKQKFFDLSRTEMQKQIDRQPNDARLHVFMGSFLNSFNAYDDSLAHLNTALLLSPNKQTLLFEIGNNYLSRGESERALEVFREAYELETNFGQARDIYALGAIYAGRNDIVEELLIPVYGTIIISDDRFVQAYFDTGQFDKVLAIWQLRVRENPDNPQFRISLAATYLQVGDRENAILEIEKAVELSPEFKEQGEFLIQEIRAGRNP